LKTFAAFGVYGATVVTAVTSQDTASVDDAFPLPARVVRSQIECVLKDLPAAAVKTGMLANAEIVTAVAEALARFQPAHVVVDPVLTAGAPGGRTLLTPDAVSVLKARLLPRAVLTPNIAEAGVLAGMMVDSLETARESARRLADLGARAVVIKGGHLEGSVATDLLYDGRTFSEFSSPRIPGGRVHGTGCTFAAALAAGLAKGDDLATAVSRAKRYVTGAIEHSVQLGRGARLLNHFWERYD
jgi:hydroxymethylpyrimidine/phosphomethylpyrimidine kinase